jgi:hypothetical protein
LLAPGELVGTVEYCCLEAVQHALRKRHGFDLAAADMYSIGATLYELLTGEMLVRTAPPNAFGEDGVESEDSCDEYDSDDDADGEDNILIEVEALLLQKVRASGSAQRQFCSTCSHVKHSCHLKLMSFWRTRHRQACAGAYQ